MPTDFVPPPTGRPIVFYSPHQDDETLFMGLVIAHHCLAARTVHVVLCTNGSTSAARAEINGEVLDSWVGHLHVPAREGYSPLSQADFGRARSREFLAACGQLGVQPENVHFGADVTHDDLPDSISVATAEELIRYWAGRFAAEGENQVGHYTMWWDDPQPDHAALGTALRNQRLANPEVFDDSRWLVKPEQATAASATGYDLPASVAPEARRMTRWAARCYEAWQPASGAYAIGYHSVGLSYFKALVSADTDYIRSL
jgi:LmbE family N-acetylglucosaminyl deacetylase